VYLHGEGSRVSGVFSVDFLLYSYDAGLWCDVEQALCRGLCGALRRKHKRLSLARYKEAIVVAVFVKLTFDAVGDDIVDAFVLIQGGHYQHSRALKETKTTSSSTHDDCLQIIILV